MPTAQWKKATLKFLFLLLATGVLFLLHHGTSFASVTTDYHYATGVNANNSSPWTNITNVIGPPDGLTSQVVNSFGLLYLKFDNGFSDIPIGSSIISVDIKVTFHGTGKWDPFVNNTSFLDQCDGARGMFGITPGGNVSLADYTSTTRSSACTYLTESRLRNGQIYLRFVRDVLLQSYTVDAIGMRVNYNPPTPTPTPTPVPPFLDLPWDYETKGLSFNEAALNINSFFDHEYPFLSAGLSDPLGTENSVIIYKGPPQSTRKYSRHDGYDYGTPAKVENGDFVLSAAAGVATYVNSCGACGNVIHIDHGNGYQTRYYHLQSNGLITNIPGQSVHVNAGEQIGKVGATGNVDPPGEDGAHIHFMVVQDKDGNGNFNDNIPDGVTDPFGWQSESPDPWENYTFSYNGLDRTGNKSYYLWNENIDGLSTSLSANGGVFTSGRNSAIFPAGATNQNLLLEIFSSPMQKLSDLISSIGSTVQIIAKDSLGNPVTTFNKPLTVEINFVGFDLSRFLIDTISIYSSSDGITWQKEPTIVDLLNQKATTEVNHLTQFALMAERLDVIPPITTAILSGDKGENNWYRSDVTLSLSLQDNQGGLGVDYTLFDIDDRGNWDTYLSPLIATNEGHFKYNFYSVDKDGNIEEEKTTEFNIDKTPPEAQIQFNPDTLDIDILGSDGSGSAIVNVIDLPKDKNSIKISDKAGNTLELIGKAKQRGRNARIVIESMQYNEDPLIDIDPTSLFVIYNLDNKSSDLRRLEQRLEIKGELKIKLIYSEKTDRTKVITKIKGQEKVKEELPGIRILQLTTENGKLKYNY